ncbi:MAG: glycosyltransferase [Lachnospiraceae bacterium]|nr:glycosyltransferase [Lachnospiraceae bacterium]
MPNYIQSPIKLTIGILVSNRIQHIRSVMEALKPLLTAVPSELIAVDTKGAESDGSIAIVREYTDKIYPFIWCNDFAAARNVCMEHANGEWFLYLDDDEVFDDVQELVNFFQSGEYLQYGSGYYYIKNYNADGGSSMGIAGRMVRRTQNTRFVGKVHEHFNEVYDPHKEFSCFAHHYGYVFQNEEEKKKHQIRNVTLLKQELAEHGMTPRNCAQMVQELYSCQDTRDAGFRFCLDSMKELKAKGQLGDACSQWLLVASVRYYKMKKDYPGAVAQAALVREKYPQSQMGQMALAGLMVELSAPEGNVRRILEYAPLYMEAWEWIKTHPEEAIVQNQLGLSSYGDEEYAVQVFQAAAVCANAVKDYELANQFWKRLPWEKEGFDGSPYYNGLRETQEGLKAMLAMKQEQAKQQKTEDIPESRQPGKQELQELVSVLKEAGPAVRSLLAAGEKNTAVELLATMQEVMVALGNKIEELYGENERTAGVISLLVECCERVWQCANMEQTEEAVLLFSEVEQNVEICGKLVAEL